MDMERVSERSRYDLSGRIALVTGGSGLLGRQHAAAVAELGARVVLADIDEPGLEEATTELRDRFGVDCVEPRKMDVTDEASIQRVRDALRERGEHVSILINNAAIDAKVTSSGLVETSRLEHFPLESWNREIGVGLTGAFLASRVFGSDMATAKGGVILNIASDLSVFSPDQRLYAVSGRAPNDQPVKPVTYPVIKTALVGLTRYLATYWASVGVRANALSPGGVYVGQPEEFVRRLTELIPVGRMAAADEYVGAVQFLCSDASEYLNGQNIVMDGGRSVL